MSWCVHSTTKFHLPLPEVHKDQCELISVTQIDGGQVLQRLVLFNSADLWQRHYKETDCPHKTSGSPGNTQENPVKILANYGFG